MRKTFLTIVVLSLLMMAISVVVFHTVLGLGWVDSLYFVVTTMTTTGYGDISLAKESTGIKLFGVMLMLTSAALMTATLGMVTDYLLHARLENFFGRSEEHRLNSSHT